MSNWRERAEKERQRLDGIAEERRIKAARPTEGRHIVKERDPTRTRFDLLGVPDKLKDINRDVWRGKGRIVEGSILGNPGAGIEASAREIRMTTVPATKLALGHYHVPGTNYGRSPDNADSDVGGRDKFGFHDKAIGQRVVGYDGKILPHNLKVYIIPPWAYQYVPGAHELLVVEDSHGLNSEILVNAGSKSGTKDQARDGLRHTINSLYFGYSIGTFDLDLARTVIDAGLLASCVARTPNPLDRDLAKEQEEIARIGPLIGTILPY